MKIGFLSVIFGLLAMVPIGIANSLSPALSKKFGERTILFFRGIFISLFLFILLIFNLRSTNFNVPQIIYSLAISAIAYVGLLFYYKALSSKKIGITSSVASGYIIISIILSVVFLKSAISAESAVLLSLVFIGIILISLNLKEFKKSIIFDKSTGIIFALFTAIAWGCSFFLAQVPNKILGPYLTSLIFEIGIFLFSFANIKQKKEKVILPNFSTLALILLIAVLSGMSTLGLYTGLKLANPNIVLALSGSTPVIYCIIGKAFYREKITLQQYAGIALIAASMFFLSL